MCLAIKTEELCWDMKGGGNACSEDQISGIGRSTVQLGDEHQNELLACGAGERRLVLTHQQLCHKALPGRQMFVKSLQCKHWHRHNYKDWAAQS